MMTLAATEDDVSGVTELTFADGNLAYAVYVTYLLRPDGRREPRVLHRRPLEEEERETIRRWLAERWDTRVEEPTWHLARKLPISAATISSWPRLFGRL
jgi:hypothetical protein